MIKSQLRQFLRIPNTALLGIAASQPITSCYHAIRPLQFDWSTVRKTTTLQSWDGNTSGNCFFFKETTEKLTPEIVDSYQTDRLMHQTFTHLKPPFCLIQCTTFSPGQEIPNLYGTRRIVTVFTKFFQQINNVPADFTPQHNFTKMRFNITFSSMPMYLKCHSPSAFLKKKKVYTFSNFPHVLYVQSVTPFSIQSNSTNRTLYIYIEG
jgi:hypothetical protein